VRQAADLQEGPPDPARQSDTPLKVRFGFAESQRPELGDAETNQRERAQFLAEPELRHVQSAGRLQLLHFLGGADFGRGSGLAGHKDRIEALGGRISLHSPPGAGTTLQIALPLSGLSRPAWEG
jgi:hypothetical protein